MAFPVCIPFFGLKLHPHAHTFEVHSVKKPCIHIVHPDGRLIPFDTYNLFYRDQLEQTRLAPLRAYSMPLNLTTISNRHNS
jgi:uncharacterized radical SAM superfamily Fe-S cluster-containing enzyme